MTNENAAKAVISEPAPEKYINKVTLKQKLLRYKRSPLSLILMILVMLSALFAVGILLFLIGFILVKGIPALSWEQFEWKYTADNVSMTPAIINTVIMVLLTLVLAVPVGIFSAIYLVEYAKRGSRLVKLVRITTETLSGIPSIVYGLFGFLMFVIGFGWGYSLISGVITLAIMVLPTVIRTTEEALLAVPDSYREGSFGLGASKTRTVFKVILPSAIPGIMSGVVLSIGRIVGESAALIFTAGTYAAIPNADNFLFSSTRTLAVHMYALYSEGLYTQQAYATAVILLVLTACINLLSSFIERKIAKNHS
ncbi:MAG: phosphate ABC transporter permease PstA [Oscillospiraceae bacterium]